MTNIITSVDQNFTIKASTSSANLTAVVAYFGKQLYSNAIVKLTSSNTQQIQLSTANAVTNITVNYNIDPDFWNVPYNNIYYRVDALYGNTSYCVSAGQVFVEPTINPI